MKSYFKKSALLILLLFSINPSWGKAATNNPAQSGPRPEVVFSAENEYSRKSKIFLADIVKVKNANRDLIKALSSFALVDVKTSTEKSNAKTEVTMFPEIRLSSSELSLKLKEFINSNEAIKTLNPLFRIPSMIHFVPSAEGQVAKSEVQNRIGQILSLECATCEFEVSIKNNVQLTSLNWKSTMLTWLYGQL